MSLRTTINNTILNACKAIAPSVKWGFVLSGAAKSNVAEGTVSCDNVTFENRAKVSPKGTSLAPVIMATAQYNITIIDMQGTTDVDAIGDDIYKCFNGSNMGGLCYDVNVDRIVYGAVPGQSSSSVIMVALTVEYPMN